MRNSVCSPQMAVLTAGNTPRRLFAQLRGAAVGRHGDEPGPGHGPCRKVRKMSQEEKNMLQSMCSCGTSIQKGPVIHRTRCELLEKRPGPPPPS